ncbi:pyrroloquinoline quinone biosynthesis protein PqqF [Erwinia sp. INIA-01]|uniref:pyrroloquinoline quinone biosynthesis protein PqqF n=1 Tax=Erwinia sp. INIA01 TaxID=2991500 RepID=UPI002224725E|nr:pyrroloquinoline quinone biosynthesis protein PqqF [Erwinia sp. INIA01]MCW1873556.1 pyrroloquinoline quinone biosynthesis protein PqqF [Erwinia sp. INIA01]
MPVQQRQLSNGLQVRIITDPQARCASALVQVGVGSLHEPDAWPGLAHLLEHVLFAGSAGFQDDERLMMWAQAQGGRLNATTLGNGTAFFFECAPALLSDGLARLTDMLVAPLLAESAISQETAAIDAEYRLLCGHQDKLADAALSAAFAAHPWQRFQVGDGARFGTDTAALRRALMRFHQQAYYAANTTLWLHGPQSADELWQLAERAGLRFADQTQPSTVLIPPLALSAQRDYLLQRPDGERLRLSFLLTGGFSEELTLLRQLLRDEAEGSLMAALRAEGLCDELRVLRPYVSVEQQVLSIELTLVAPHHAAGAEGLLHHWLRRLAGLSDEQLQHYAALAVREFNRLPVMDRLRERAFGFAPPEAWPLRWQPLLAQLVAENLTRLRSGRQETGQTPLSREGAIEQPRPAGGLQTEPRGTGDNRITRYRLVQGFNLPLAARRLDKPALPGVIPALDFFPRPQPTFTAESLSAELPLPHYNPDGGQAVLLLSPAAVMPLPWGQIMQAALRALAGSCIHGGGELKLECYQGLWLIQLSGSPELMMATLSSLTARLAALPAVAIEQGEREYQRQQRAQQADIVVRALINALPPLWQNASHASSVSPLPAMHWQASLYGGSRELHQQIARQLSHFPGRVNSLVEASRPLPVPQREYSVVTDSNDAAVVLFCPLNGSTPQAVAAWRCLALIFQPAFFQQLRVEQNIGYVVSCRWWQVAGRAGILFCLQSPTLTHDDLWQAIEAFLQRMATSLASLTADRLAEYRRVLLDSLNPHHDDPLTASREEWLQQQDPAPALTAEAVEQLSLTDLQYHHQQLLQQRQLCWRVSNRKNTIV